MAPKEPKTPGAQPGGTPDDNGANNAGNPSEEQSASFESMEGPDIETPLGSDAGPSAAADAGDSPLTAEDLAFLADPSAGASSLGSVPVDPADEHLADLKRVTAEYANYRRRTEANRQIEKDRAVGDVVKQLLPVLDDLDRAEKHGDLVEGGPLTSIAQKLRAIVQRFGVAPYGEIGEAFDPEQHEAIFQKPNSEVTAPTVADVVERGYRIGDANLRVARVVVDTPAD
ncbi:nucleotide exchange factor GrpE [Naasia lichenicola]|nr:nucleotide exchange factor GrpE [Naasia lichenicola]